MFGLFGKQGAKAPEDRLAECQKKRDWAGLCPLLSKQTNHVFQLLFMSQRLLSTL